MARFEIYQDAGEGFRWRLRAGNHRIIADSAEGYRDRGDCEHGIGLVRALGEPEIYRDQAGAYRWRLRAGNGRIVADSGEGYVSRHGCARGVGAVRRAVTGAAIHG
jgi:uncharacterized protein YegP (UPF0339 family)